MPTRSPKRPGQRGSGQPSPLARVTHLGRPGLGARRAASCRGGVRGSGLARGPGAATPGPPPGPGLRAGAAGRCVRQGGPGGPRCGGKLVPGKPRPAAEGPRARSQVRGRRSPRPARSRIPAGGRSSGDSPGPATALGFESEPAVTPSAPRRPRAFPSSAARGQWDTRLRPRPQKAGAPRAARGSPRRVAERQRQRNGARAGSVAHLRGAPEPRCRAWRRRDAGTRCGAIVGPTPTRAPRGRSSLAPRRPSRPARPGPRSGRPVRAGPLRREGPGSHTGSGGGGTLGGASPTRTPPPAGWMAARGLRLHAGCLH